MQLETLPYIKNSFELFEHFANCPDAVLLTSAGSTYGRFDILTAYPAATITEHTSTTTEPILLIQQTLTDLGLTQQHIPESVQHLPFHLGAIGYISYDHATALLPINKHPHHDILLDDIRINIYDWSIVTDHDTQQTWLIATDNHPQLNAIKQQLKTKPTEYPDHFKLTAPFQSNMTYNDYAQAFRNIQYHIQQGNCYQINLAQRFKSHFQGSPWAAFKTLAQQFPTPFAAYLNLPQGAILSISPERFIEVQNNQAMTKPIKGTQARHANQHLDEQAAQTLLHSQKDRAENLMIVDLLRNDFSKCCQPGSVKVPSLFEIESFPNIHHLVSTVIGKLNENQDATDLLSACFPGGSITGTPKLAAMKIIHECEPHHRSVYCGSIGYINCNGNMDSNICIRTLICHQNTIYCHTGGAIIADSTLNNEYQETLTKVSHLLKTLEHL